jgi:pimeloyl-ACP methyl ester carboxylesterase
VFIAPAEQRWLIWCLGNGEVYEFGLAERQSVATAVGCNLLVFNYRGCGFSVGPVYCAEDLVDDCAACVRHLRSSFGTPDHRIMLFGHSIGGAVAALTKRHHAPNAPLVVERSFRDFPSAACGVFRSISQQILGFSLPIHPLVIYGMLSSVFKVRALGVFYFITRPYLFIFILPLPKCDCRGDLIYSQYGRIWRAHA